MPLCPPPLPPKGSGGVREWCNPWGRISSEVIKFPTSALVGFWDCWQFGWL